MVLPVHGMQGGKKPKGKKKKVSLSLEAAERERTDDTEGCAMMGIGSGEEDGSGVLGLGANSSGWWLRDSVVEELKGVAWLAGRGG